MENSEIIEQLCKKLGVTEEDLLQFARDEEKIDQIKQYSCQPIMVAPQGTPTGCIMSREDHILCHPNMREESRRHK